MSISISGGVHLGDNDGAPYISLHVQTGILPTIDLNIGPGGSLGLGGDLLQGLPISQFLPGSSAEPALPSSIASADQSNVQSGNAPVAATHANDSQAGGISLHLGDTVVHVPLGLTNLNL